MHKNKCSWCLASNLFKPVGREQGCCTHVAFSPEALQARDLSEPIHLSMSPYIQTGAKWSCVWKVFKCASMSKELFLCKRSWADDRVFEFCWGIEQAALSASSAAPLKGWICSPPVGFSASWFHPHIFQCRVPPAVPGGCCLLWLMSPCPSPSFDCTKN